MDNNYTTAGLGLGSILAVTLSWSKNKSIRWSVFHGILGWFYVVYFAITRKKEIK
jgi:hypothetical protein